MILRLFILHPSAGGGGILFIAKCLEVEGMSFNRSMGSGLRIGCILGSSICMMDSSCIWGKARAAITIS